MRIVDLTAVSMTKISSGQSMVSGYFVKWFVRKLFECVGWIITCKHSQVPISSLFDRLRMSFDHHSVRDRSCAGNSFTGLAVDVH